MKPFIIPYVVFPFHVMVYFGQDREPLFNIASKYIDDEDLKEFREDEFKDGYAAMFRSGASLIYCREEPRDPRTMGILSHEIFHAVSILLDRVEVHLTSSSEEIYAYLTGYLTEEIYKHIKLKK